MPARSPKTIRAASMDFDAIIHNGTLVTVDAHMRIIEKGWIGIQAGVIRAIETAAPDTPPRRRP
jgi:cytosine/adenosine deaminase-related metal-dependent hydrolase